MDPSGVKAILPPQSQASDGTLLSTVRTCRSRLYNRKGQYLLELDRYSVQNSAGVAKAVGPGRTFENLVRVEARVLNEFWKDFPQLTAWFKPGVNPDVLTAHFGVVWLNVEMLLATINNGQLESERCLSDYTTRYRVNHDFLVEYYRSVPGIADVDGIARLAVDDLMVDLRMAKLTKKAYLDEVEITALLMFLIAYYEKDLFADANRLKAFVDMLVKELHEHYKSTYWNYAERLATLMIVVGEFHQVMREEEQWWTTLELYCCQAPGKFTNIYEFRRSVNFLAQ